MTHDDRMETITDPAAIRATDEPDERGDFPCCTTPAPVSGAGLDLDAIEARVRAATPGPWERRIGPREGYSIKEKAKYMRGCAIDNGEPLQVLIADSDRPGIDYLVPALTGDGPLAEANAEFIAHAREDVPALVAEVRRLTEFRDWWKASSLANAEDVRRLTAICHDWRDRSESAEAEVGTLRAKAAAVVDEYPHADTCGSMLTPGAGYPCSCWKSDLRAALATTGEGQ